jgi:protein-tyrosine-phosphatase
VTSDARPVVCFVCTGNAARSVMARRMFAEVAPGYRATSAGTLVLEGHPMSSRTRSALRGHGLTDPDHRSRQFGATEAAADLIVVMEPDHVAWVRRHQQWVTRAGGGMLVLVGVLLVTGLWDQAVTWIQIQLVSDFEVAV